MQREQRETPTKTVEEFGAAIQRLGLVIEPNGDATETAGVLNPACARTPDGELLLYPRDVAEGNISRVGRVRVEQRAEAFEVVRMGFALEPEADYEIRPHPGYGCEDPRVTYVQPLQQYVMAYTAFGPDGPRIAVAISRDARAWQRLGLMRFDQPGLHVGDDKDAAFFPEPVFSPNGVESLAFYHRPMLHLSAVDGRAAVPMILQMPYADRESIRIGYVPLAPAIADVKNILDVVESELFLSPSDQWASIKVGAGTPPVRIAEGWMSLYHGVDLVDGKAARPTFRYRAGIVISDIREPHKLLYRSPQPILSPEADRELNGVVHNVVFPTGIDPRNDLGSRVFDIYYGMADYSVGAARLTLS